MRFEEVEKLTTEELMKMTKKQLITLYEGLTGGPIGFTVKKKEDIVRTIKQNIRGRSRGKAFSKYA